MMEIQVSSVEVVDEDEPRYRIGTVAAMVRLHPQTIRYYESIGLISPRRVRRMRLYSERDVARLRQIVELTQLGVNLAGVEIILRLREQIAALQAEIERLRALLGAEPSPSSEPEQRFIQ
ncbi:MerR family transcriptional regulator [Thermoflexus sp.]|uniref:MerR family transcriptional regulator n=1 Tax=Thermoflexus sp. TaxID=1969742 RepID=UPI002ADE76DF|nr:MerR family transcriptional regulator [Thermoflexus sp.]